MPTFLQFLLCFVVMGNAQRPCNNDDELHWEDGMNSETRTIDLAPCTEGGALKTHIYLPKNFSKAIRVKVVSIKHKASFYAPLFNGFFEILVIEKGEDSKGRERIIKRKDLIKEGDTIVSSASTTVMSVMVGQGNPRSSAQITFQFTLEDEGCANPFLEARLGSPATIWTKMLENGCDFSVDTDEPGVALELTSVSSSFNNVNKSTEILAYNGYDMIHDVSHRIEQSEFKRALKKYLGASRVTFHVVNPPSMDSNEAFMTVSSLVDDCQCPEAEVTINTTYSSKYEAFVFKMTKPQCFHLNCTVKVQIAEELRNSHRLQIIPFFHMEMSDAYAIKEGDAEYINLIHRAFEFTSIHPTIMLSYSKQDHLIYHYVAVWLVGK